MVFEWTRMVPVRGGENGSKMQASDLDNVVNHRYRIKWEEISGENET